MAVNLSNYKILLVEDYSTMRNSIKEMLIRGANAQYIAEAENAKVALQAMEKQSFDIVLCDYNLGVGRTGQQVLEEAKHRKLLPPSAIFIMVTAEQSTNMVLSAMDNRPNEYLVKPFNGQQLLSRIEKLLQRKTFFAEIDAAIDRDDLPRAIAHCEKLLAQADLKMRSQLLKVLAELLTNVGDFKKAKACYQEVLLQRDLTWAKHGLGVIAYLENNFITAIELFQQVLVAAPMMVETYDWLVKAYEAIEQPNSAQQSIQLAVELSPLAVLRQQKLAELAEKTGNNELALKAYKSSIRYGEYSIYKKSQDFYGLAKLYFKTENTLEAQKLIHQMRKTFPNNQEMEIRASCLETEIYFKQHQWPLSENAYEKIKTINTLHQELPKDLLLDIAEVHYLLGNVDSCNQLLESLIGNYVDDDIFMKELIARHHAFSGDEYFADQLFLRTKLDLLDVNNKGVTLFKQGRVDEALALMKDAYCKVPNNKFILVNLIKIMLQEMKSIGVTKEKYLELSRFILKASALGAPKNKTGHAKMELAKLLSSNSDPLKSHQNQQLTTV